MRTTYHSSTLQNIIISTFKCLSVVVKKREIETESERWLTCVWIDSKLTLTFLILTGSSLNTTAHYRHEMQCVGGKKTWSWRSQCVFMHISLVGPRFSVGRITTKCSISFSCKTHDLTQIIPYSFICWVPCVRQKKKSILWFYDYDDGVCQPQCIPSICRKTWPSENCWWDIIWEVYCAQQQQQKRFKIEKSIL